MTELQKEQIAALRMQEYGYSTIAASLGLTKSQVSAFCQRNKLSGTKAKSHTSTFPAANHCLSCGKELFQPVGRKPIKFCSNSCRTMWWNSHPEKVNRKAFYVFNCACCGRSFSAYGNSHRKYCSHACYITARFKGGACHD